MKRIFAVLFSLCIMAGAVFSKGYDGDVQFHLGAGFDSYILNTTSRTNDSSFIETARCSPRYPPILPAIFR